MLDTHRVMSFLPLMPYQVVADVGCGPGYFTIPLAKFAFDGKVYAVDIYEEMLAVVRSAAEAVRLTNVETVLTTRRRVGLEDDSIDGAMAAFVLSDTPKPGKILTDLKTALRKGAWLAVIEWREPGTDGGPPSEDHIGEEQASELAREAEFRMTGRYDLSPLHYMLVFRA